MIDHDLHQAVEHILDGDGTYYGINCDKVYDEVLSNKEVGRKLLKLVLEGEDREAFYLALRECQDKAESMLLSTERANVEIGEGLL